MRLHAIELILLSLILVFLILAYSRRLVYTIPTGHVGVVWKRFGGGTDLCDVLPEGLRIVWPWDVVSVYDVRLRMADQDLEILSRDGLSMKINIVYRFQLYQDAVPVVHQYVGSDWAETLVRPEVAARARDVLSQNTPAEIYASRRSDIEQQILGSVRSHLYSEFEPVNAGLSALDDRQSIPIPRKTPLAASRFFDLPKHSQCRDQKRWNHLPWITVDAVLIRAITLPHAVAAAIERKNEQQQALQEYDYRLQREQKESARKQIEAQGIAAFQRTVSGGITDDYLRWRGIEATLALARSSNSKVVVIGSGKDGLPIILGNDPGQGPGPRRSR